jgi:hypothetical protein
MMRPLLFGWPVGFALATSPLTTANAHGDPQLEDQKVITIQVPSSAAFPESKPSSEPFQLAVPQNAVELVWEVDSPQKDRIRFSVLADGIIKIKDLKDGAKTRTLRGNRLAIGQVSGASTPFVINVYAHIVHWDR